MYNKSKRRCRSRSQQRVNKKARPRIQKETNGGDDNVERLKKRRKYYIKNILKHYLNQKKKKF